jgi:hypothetical protein
MRRRAQLVLKYKDAAIAVFENLAERMNPIVQPVVACNQIIALGIEPWEPDGLVNQAKFEVPDITHIPPDEIVFGLQF